MKVADVVEQHGGPVEEDDEPGDEEDAATPASAADPTAAAKKKKKKKKKKNAAAAAISEADTNGTADVATGATDDHVVDPDDKEADEPEGSSPPLSSSAACLITENQKALNLIKMDPNRYNPMNFECESGKSVIPFFLEGMEG